MKRGKVLKSDGISLPDGRAIKSLSEGRVTSTWVYCKLTKLNKRR